MITMKNIAFNEAGTECYGDVPGLSNCHNKQTNHVCVTSVFCHVVSGGNHDKNYYWRAKVNCSKECLSYTTVLRQEQFLSTLQGPYESILFFLHFWYLKKLPTKTEWPFERKSTKHCFVCCPFKACFLLVGNFSAFFMCGSHRFRSRFFWFATFNTSTITWSNHCISVLV